MERNETRRRPTGLGATIRLGFLFGAIYFIQGVSDPNTGLISQPDNSLLRRWGESPKEVATFGALLALPWCLKPLFGLMSDFLPLGCYRRKSYLVAASLAALVGFGAVYVTPLPEGAKRPLLSWLMLASLGIIFADVVADALMVETGRPLGTTGRLQSVQWAAINVGSILTGVVGGVFSERHLQKTGFLLCAALMALTLFLAIFFIDEVPRPPRRNWGKSMDQLKDALQSSPVVVIGLFLFIWNFNPFTQSVLYMHMTKELGYSDEFYGKTVSLIAIGSLTACIAYGMYCRHVPMGWLAHLSIVSGMVSSLVYWPMRDETSASIVSLASGFTYATGNLVLVGLAARASSLEAPGTFFALFMAVCNVGAATGTWVGGVLYGYGTELWGPVAAFNGLLVIAAATTAACWLLLPLLPESLLGAMGEETDSRPQHAPPCRLSLRESTPFRGAKGGDT